jgi:hypothetical protein
MSKPGVIVRKSKAGSLSPVSAFDAETLDAFIPNTEFDLKPRTRRSLPQQRLYWAMLANMIDATWLSEKWPTTSHLHEALLRDLGYVRVTFDLDGKPHLTRDSTAFDAMPADAFREYFDAAMKRLAELTGVDPLIMDAAPSVGLEHLLPMEGQDA